MCRNEGGLEFPGAAEVRMICRLACEVGSSIDRKDAMPHLTVYPCRTAVYKMVENKLC